MDDYRVGKRKYAKRTRRITSCSECYRRKQKCNRQRPCDGCSSRGVPGRCTYGSTDGPRPSQSPTSSKNLDINDPVSVVDDPNLITLESGLGYVNTSENSMLETPVATTTVRVRSKGHRRSSMVLSHDASDDLVYLLGHLPGPSLIQRLIGVFFDQANWYFSVLDRCFFDERNRSFLSWYQSESRGQTTYETYGFAALLLQVIAIALQFLPQADILDESVMSFTQADVDSKSQACSEAGESSLALFNRRAPDLSSVEAEIMRCAWLKNSGRGLDAWHSLSNAVRHAQDLKLHLEPALHAKGDTSADYLIETWHCEHRRRIWACLVAWDAHMALQLGRPRMVNISDCTAGKPTNCDTPRDMSRTLLRSTTASSDIPSHYTSHLVKYEIALMIHRAMDRGLLRTGSGHEEGVGMMHHELEQMSLRLPPAFWRSGPDTSWDFMYPCIPKLRLQIQIIMESFLLALHRPHTLTCHRSLAAAVQAAKSVLDLSQTLFELVEDNQHKTFTLVFYTIDAGMFLVAALMKVGAGERTLGVTSKALHGSLEQAVKRLDCQSRFHTVATAGKRILEAYLSQHKHSAQTPAHASALTEVLLNSSPVTTARDDINSTDALWPHNMNEDEDFWTNMINDTGSTNAWLDSNLDFRTPDLCTLTGDTFVDNGSMV